MIRRMKAKPSKASSTFGFILGLAFVAVGGIVVIPLLGPFGMIWTLFAVMITIYHGLNIFTKKGIALYTIESENLTDNIEGRLKKLDGLRNEGLLTSEEYQKKKEEILKEL
jgi:hypothetical protein